MFFFGLPLMSIRSLGLKTLMASVALGDILLRFSRNVKSLSLYGFAFPPVRFSSKQVLTLVGHRSSGWNVREKRFLSDAPRTLRTNKLNKNMVSLGNFPCIHHKLSCRSFAGRPSM